MNKLPLEMKYDSNKVGYIDFDSLSYNPQRIDFKTIAYDNNIDSMKVYSTFYYLASTSDYILKIDNYNSRRYYDENRRIVSGLLSRQKNIKKVEFPIGYIIKSSEVVGQIVRYYKNGESLKNLCINGDLEELKKFYHCDNDGLHNLFNIYLDILSILEELFEKGITYRDIHGGNFILYNNQVKLIDFDSRYIDYSTIPYFMYMIMRNYREMINKLNYTLGYDYDFNYELEKISFDNARYSIKKLENKIRRYR